MPIQKLTLKQIDKIRVLYESGVKVSQILNEFKNTITGSYVRKLAKEKKWKIQEDAKEYYEAEKIVNKQKILNQFKSKQKQEDFKTVKSIADKEAVKLATRELTVQEMKQEMMENAFKTANKILRCANKLMDTEETFEYKTEDVFYQGIKTEDVKRSIIKKQFIPDLSALNSIVKPFLETSGFLHKPVIEINNNIETNVHNENETKTRIMDIIESINPQPSNLKDVYEQCEQ